MVKVVMTMPIISVIIHIHSLVVAVILNSLGGDAKVEKTQKY